MSSHESPKPLSGDLVEGGVEGAANLVGVGVGFALAGPLGAVIGAIVSPIVRLSLTRVIRDWFQRQLSPWQQNRIESVSILAATYIQTHLEHGDEIRSDGFFDPTPVGDRPAADEVVDRVLHAVSMEEQYKKIPFYARLVANLSLKQNDGIDRSTAAMLTDRVAALTYRQLVLLAVCNTPELWATAAPGFGTNMFDDQSFETQLAVTELTGLRDQGLLPSNNNLSLAHALYKLTRPSMFGELAYRLMELDRIDRSELIAQVKILRYPTEQLGQ